MNVFTARGTHDSLHMAGEKVTTSHGTDASQKADRWPHIAEPVTPWTLWRETRVGAAEGRRVRDGPLPNIPRCFKMSPILAWASAILGACTSAALRKHTCWRFHAATRLWRLWGPLGLVLHVRLTPSHNKDEYEVAQLDIPFSVPSSACSTSHLSKGLCV